MKITREFGLLFDCGIATKIVCHVFSVEFSEIVFYSASRQSAENCATESVLLPKYFFYNGFWAFIDTIQL